VRLETGPALVAPAGEIDDLGALGRRLGGVQRFSRPIDGVGVVVA